DAWRAVARTALLAGVAPHDIAWNGDAQSGLLAGIDMMSLAPVRNPPRVSSTFLSLAASVLCHRDTQRHALLYRLLWRIGNGEAKLLSRATDIDVNRAQVLAKTVSRDCHKMKAFVRFREVPGQDNAYVAWFEPDHHIVDRVAPFFARRFAGMRWAILTPDRRAWWDGMTLQFGPGGSRADAPADDAQENLWRTYYANIFNPARLNPTMMRQEMAQKYWKNLPETQLLPDLIRDAGQRVRDMAERTPQPARRRIPEARTESAPLDFDGSIDSLARAAHQCRRCELWKPATEVVFGQGPENARVMIVGEQPGDQEDLRGKPFVGPAGKLLDRAFDSLGLDRASFYMTNSVKHFRYEQRGKLRMHKNPAVSHVSACRPWLLGELAAVQPRIVVCLGAIAARAILGNDFRLTDQRGRWHNVGDGKRALATVHPSWVLRQPSERRDEAFADFVADLNVLKDAIDMDQRLLNTP
ncbi:MAG: UdgX family uracil-DNA binding protein, partial [Dokdonella sp.]